MRILTIDVGTGTQDILLFDSSRRLENCVKMIMPSPTAIAAQRIRKATAERLPVLLTGFNMGGGPCRWALEDHLRSGETAYATPQAARTFDDDLSQVEALGVRLVSEDETAYPEGAVPVRLADLDMSAIRSALKAFEVDTEFDGVAVAALDHGEAPPGISDRVFRFEHIRRVLAEKQSLLGFAYLSNELPPYLTRLKDIGHQVGKPAVPLLLLDTGPAAALGALEDPLVAHSDRKLVVNTGNMHTMAVHMEEDRLLGLFEHHTGALSPEQLDLFLNKLADGSLTHEEIFDSEGHGSHLLQPARGASKPLVAITGPQRGRFSQMASEPYPAVPHGDMMIAGCFGLLRGFAARMAEWRDEIEEALVVDR
ncbi:MAG: DUF1786 domain-containing protein [Dehalococcoidia bacterium]|nr:DUF1786 domain-containing protein [Dehalococcoidia bacterium]